MTKPLGFREVLFFPADTKPNSGGAMTYTCQITRNWIGQPKELVIYNENEVVGRSILSNSFDFGSNPVQIYESEFIEAFNIIEASEVHETSRQGRYDISFLKRRSFTSSDHIEIKYKGQSFYCDPFHHEMKDSNLQRLGKMRIDREWGFRNAVIELARPEHKEFIIYMLLYFQFTWRRAYTPS